MFAEVVDTLLSAIYALCQTTRELLHPNTLIRNPLCYSSTFLTHDQDSGYKIVCGAVYRPLIAHFPMLQAEVVVRVESELGMGAVRPLLRATDLPLGITCDRLHSRDRIKQALMSKRASH